MANAYQWPELDNTDDASIVSTDTSYTITTGDTGEGIHDIYSVYNVTKEYYLTSRPYGWIRDQLTMDTQTGNPMYFAYGGETSDGTTTIYLYPTSDGSYTIRTSYNKKPDLNNTFNDSTYISMPELPVILRAYAMAISERGEDGGNSYSEIDMMAREALSDSIALYMKNTPGICWYAN